LNIYLSLFVYIGPEKPQWGVANYVYIRTYTHTYIHVLLNVTCYVISKNHERARCWGKNSSYMTSDLMFYDAIAAQQFGNKRVESLHTNAGMLEKRFRITVKFNTRNCVGEEISSL